MATREEIDSVRSAVNIVDVISLHVALKRQGQIWKGLCPFHGEKTPSFNVNPATGSFHCFGCGKGGDVIKFLQESEGLTFNEAITRLADSVGITLSKGANPDPLAGKRDKLYAALEAATQFYQETLTGSDIAKAYLAKRGLTAASIQQFRIGYAAESPDAMAAHLRRSKVQIEDAVEAGIVSKGDRQYGSIWDKLRGRIVFPIVDIHDRPIAFGGRQIEDIKERAKYLNTAETPLFSKGKTFYGMSHARKAIVDAGFAIVVEGYLDVVSAHQAGFSNVVATLGTSLTEQHADQLSRHAQQVRLAFDADPAGVRAADKSAAIFEAKGIDALVLDLPAGEDPDSLVRAGRLVEFQSAIDNARPIREFKLRTILSFISSKPRTEAELMQLFKRNVLPVLLSVQSVIEKESYIRLCAPAHPMYTNGSAAAELQIRQEIEAASNAKSGAKSASNSSSKQQWTRTSSGKWRLASPPAAPVAPPPNVVERAEENLLRAIASADKTLSNILADGVQIAELFRSKPAGELARRMLKYRENNKGVIGSHIVSDLDSEDAISKLALRIFAGAMNYAPLNSEVISDSLDRLRKESATTQERTLKTLADSGDIEARQELHRKMREKHVLN